MATEFVLSFKDGRSIGRVDEIRTLLERVVPGIKFYWTTSGPEKLKIAKERGVEFPQALRVSLESLPSLLEGVANGAGWQMTFGLGHSDPLTELIAEPRGPNPQMSEWMREMEAALGTQFRIHGEPAVK